jgi:hypothetical protein
MWFSLSIIPDKAKKYKFMDDERELSAIFGELSLVNQAELLAKARQARWDENRSGDNRGKPAPGDGQER